MGMKGVHETRLLDEITCASEAGEGGLAVHGTFEVHWNFIKSQGLSRAQRQHIHMTVGSSCHKQIRGIRKNAEIFIWVDVGLAMKDGVIFYNSRNDVVLSAGLKGWIAPKYFKKVTKVNPITG